MFDHFRRLTKRMKSQKAIIRITRKLLRRMRAVLLSGKMYVKGIDGDVTSQHIDAPALPASKPKGKPRKTAIAVATE